MRHLAVALALVAAAPAAACLIGTPVPVQAQTLRSDDGVISVAETRWSGVFDWSSGERRDATLYFRSDGVLIYAYAGTTYDNGRWVQRERLVTFQTNDYFAVFAGTTDGARFAGTSYNVGGDRGTFTFARDGTSGAGGPKN